MLMAKGANLLQPLFNLLDRQGVVLDVQSLCRPRAGEHHKELRSKLLQRPGQFLALGVLADKIKDRQVAFGVAYHGDVILQLQEADVDRKSTRLNSSHLGISYAV